MIKPDLYDPKLNRAYAELGAYYGVLIDPARASKPKDKPRVERMVPYVRDSMWRGRDWTSEAQIHEREQQHTMTKPAGITDGRMTTVSSPCGFSAR